MAEEQFQSKCPHCGFPVETQEHGPDCPNNPSNSVEADEQPEEETADQFKLREYTREQLPEERERLVGELQELRTTYYEQQAAIQEQLEQIGFTMSKKEQELDTLQKEVTQLKQIVGEKSGTLVSRIWHSSSIRAMETEISKKEPGMEKLVRALLNFMKAILMILNSIGKKNVLRSLSD